MSNKNDTATILLPGRGRLIVANLFPELDELRKREWTFKQWHSTPALIGKKDGSQVQYFGQKYDPDYFDLVEYGWTHDHCEICSTVLCANNEAGETNGYVSDGDWLCTTCYKYLVAPTDLDDVFRKLATD